MVIAPTTVITTLAIADITVLIAPPIAEKMAPWNFSAKQPLGERNATASRQKPLAIMAIELWLRCH